jgi:hypothetical protein
MIRKVLAFTVFLLGSSLSASSQTELIASSESISKENSGNRLVTDHRLSPLELFRAVDPQPQAELSIWKSLESELDIKAAKSSDQIQLLRQIFQKSHQRLFKKYEQHSSFNAMLASGAFDCVSGSAALGMLLKRFGFNFEIIETDYHVFILTEVEGKKIVLESTLPVGGMITTPSEVEKYLNSYKPNQSESSKVFNQRLAGTDATQLDNSIFRTVNLQELAGLQFYNDAIVHFNSQEYDMAIDQLNKAYLLYPSERILGLLELSQDLAKSTR